MTEQNDTQESGQAKAGAIIVPVTLFEQNCTIIWDEPSKKAVVIDPGGDVPKILDAIKQTGVTVEKIWLTHGHIDHVGGAADLRDALKVPIEGPHQADKFLLDNVVESGARFGMTGVRNFAPDRWLDEGDARLDRRSALSTSCTAPATRPAAWCSSTRICGFAHVGDVLFAGSVGRTDLPGGSHATLIESIKTKLLPLGDDVGFICGHGAGSSIGQERMTNPFITGYVRVCSRGLRSRFTARAQVAPTSAATTGTTREWGQGTGVRRPSQFCGDGSARSAPSARTGADLRAPAGRAADVR